MPFPIMMKRGPSTELFASITALNPEPLLGLLPLCTDRTNRFARELADFHGADARMCGGMMIVFVYFLLRLDVGGLHFGQPWFGFFS